MKTPKFINVLGEKFGWKFNPRPRAALDPNDIWVEIYNPMEEEITFVSYHPDKDKHTFMDKTPRDWMVIKCKPDDFCFLPHQKYIGSVPSGAPCVVQKNFGPAAFKGNKCNRAIVKKVQS